ncbi:MlaD family protein [Kordiimonas pumila]|uniref:MlaD family protein n=1 Tax=Kordiimonas pumila TaxID=2161677 RepID=A0ABV7D0U5_9PROT|nr:MlaD family protein [Kordiimonas pumila]
METRASYILVGSFVLAFLAGLIAFAIWIAKVDLDAEYTEYDIFFDGSVSGLYKRSIVYYSGIPVGDVRDITLAPKNPQKVRVIVRLRAEVPVNQSTRARLEFQGLTGVAYIELKSGPDGGEQVKPKPGRERASIASEESAFQAVYANAPNLINEAINAILQAQKLLSDENILAVSTSLKNTEKFTGNLAKGSEDITAIVAEVRALLVEVTEATQKISALADTGNTLLEGDGAVLLKEAVTTLQSAQALINHLDGFVTANEDNVTQFVGNSLPEVSRMIIDLRTTAQSLSRLMTRIERNPSEALFGGKETHYDLKSRDTKGDKK